jgi:hypothetical protein
MKTSELTGAALDWAVAKCEGYTDYCGATDKMLPPRKEYGWVQLFDLNYSTNWAQGGPIIEREKIRLDTTWNWEDGYWSARMDTVGGWWLGDTPLIAAMRCYVVSKLGDDVEVPEELVCQ